MDSVRSAPPNGRTGFAGLQFKPSRGTTDAGSRREENSAKLSSSHGERHWSSPTSEYHHWCASSCATTCASSAIRTRPGYSMPEPKPPNVPGPGTRSISETPAGPYHEVYVSTVARATRSESRAPGGLSPGVPKERSRTPPLVVSEETEKRPSAIAKSRACGASATSRRIPCGSDDVRVTVPVVAATTRRGRSSRTDQRDTSE